MLLGRHGHRRQAVNPLRPQHDAKAHAVLQLACQLINHAGRGPALVLLTDGGAPLRIARPGRPLLHREPPTVPVADTVGAGDSLAAGLLTGLLDAGVTSRAALEALPDERLLGLVDDAALVAAATTWVSLLAWGGFAEDDAPHLGPLLVLAALVAVVGGLGRAARVPAAVLVPLQLLSAGAAAVAVVAGLVVRARPGGGS